MMHDSTPDITCFPALFDVSYYNNRRLSGLHSQRPRMHAAIMVSKHTLKSRAARTEHVRVQTYEACLYLRCPRISDFGTSIQHKCVLYVRPKGISKHKARVRRARVSRETKKTTLKCIVNMCARGVRAFSANAKGVLECCVAQSKILMFGVCNLLIGDHASPSQRCHCPPQAMSLPPRPSFLTHDHAPRKRVPGRSNVAARKSGRSAGRQKRPGCRT